MISLPVFTKAFNGTYRRKSVVTSIDAWTGNTMMAGGLYLYLTVEFSKDDKTGRIIVACDKFTYAAPIIWNSYQLFNKSMVSRMFGKLFSEPPPPPEWNSPSFLRTETSNFSHAVIQNPMISPKIVLEVDVKDEDVGEIMMLMALEYAQ